MNNAIKNRFLNYKYLFLLVILIVIFFVYDRLSSTLDRMEIREGQFSQKEPEENEVGKLDIAADEKKQIEITQSEAWEAKKEEFTFEALVDEIVAMEGVAFQNLIMANYGQLFDSLNLSDEKKEALIKAIVENMAYHRALWLRKQDGSLSTEEIAVLSEGHTEEAVALSILSDEEMEAYYIFKADEKKRSQKKFEEDTYIDLQERAPGLSKKNKQLIATLIAEDETNNRSRYREEAIEEGIAEDDIPQILLRSQEKMIASVLKKAGGQLNESEFVLLQKYLEESYESNKRLLEGF